MQWLENIWLILFMVWGLPLGYYRSRFRKTVYQTDRWLINIKPVFIREIKGLLGNIYPDNTLYIRQRNFYRFYLSVYFILFFLYFFFNSDINLFSGNSMNKIDIGSRIPAFTLPDQNGRMVDISSMIGKKNMVIYFYPKDDSPGCTKEACSFRDQYEIFRMADAEIIGISSDDVESHKQFAKKHNLKYILLSDEGNKVRNLFGVPTNLFGLISGRVTYIVDKQGIVIHTFNSQMQAEKHIEESIKALKNISYGN
jgi:thioredoxin-dependent peroxiredoxin